MAKKDKKSSGGRSNGASMNDQLSHLFEHDSKITVKKPEEKPEKNPYKSYNQRKKNVIGTPRQGEASPHAPYNFAEFCSVVMPDTQETRHNEIGGENLFTGYLDYSFKNHTPLMIDDGKGDFYKNKEGVYTVPGSTMRGLVRANAQILGFSGVSGDVDDYFLMYRAVAGGYLKDSYNTILGSGTKQVNGHQISVLSNVKAGYIKCEGTEYRLYKTVGDKDKRFSNAAANYYVVSERYILEQAPENFAFLIRKNQYLLQNLNKGKNSFVSFVKNGKKHYKGTENKKYKPYSIKITYGVHDHKVTGIAEQGLGENGYVLSSGWMNEKKVVYVIPERDESNSILLPGESVAAYRADYNKKINTIPKEHRSFYDLPKEGEVRPVFYISLNGRLYFGYTPRLRLMYDYTIADGIKQEKEAGTRDYVEAIFGYADDKYSYKSKVYFTDAVLTNNKECKESDKAELILSEPKPTSYLEYLKQQTGEEVKTYNNDGFALRGSKQYWIKKSLDRYEVSGNQNVNIRSTMNPIESDSEFSGQIRFHNLTQEELGLLIWSIRLEEDSRMNLGKAKAYGYGHIELKDLKLFLCQEKAIYKASLDAFGRDPYKEQTMEVRDEFVEAYRKRLADWLKTAGIKTDHRNSKSPKEVIMGNPSIKEFFEMKSNIIEANTALYMTLDEFKVCKQKNYALPTASNAYKWTQKKK